MPRGKKLPDISGNLQIFEELEKDSQTIESSNIQTKIQDPHKINIKQQHILDCPILSSLLYLYNTIYYTFNYIFFQKCMNLEF